MQNDQGMSVPQENKDVTFKVIKIDVNNANPDMILAMPVFDKSGRIIISKGTKLTAMFIGKMQKWGINKISVYAVPEELKQDFKVPEEPESLAPFNEEPEPVEPEKNNIDEKAEKALEARFKNVASNDKMLGFMLLAKKHLLDMDVDPNKIPEMVEKLLEKQI